MKNGFANGQCCSFGANRPRNASTWRSIKYLPIAASHQGDELSLLHDGLELLAPLGAGGHLSAEQVAGRQVGVAVLGHYPFALGALPRAGPA